MTGHRIDLEELLRPTDTHGWRMTPTIKLDVEDWVDNPASFKHGEPGQIWGPAHVKLLVAPDGGRTLRVSD